MTVKRSSPNAGNIACRGRRRTALVAAASALGAMLMLASVGPASAKDAPASPPAATRCADLALVLAVDTSGSIDAREFALQVQGLLHGVSPPVRSLGAGDGGRGRRRRGVLG